MAKTILTEKIIKLTSPFLMKCMLPSVVLQLLSENDCRNQRGCG